jgi:DNA-binding helix-hairpin-helix protein with protein kinase domain
MKQPPNTLPLSALPHNLANLFERAFSQEGIKDGFRPTPKEWIIALEDLNNQLKRCNNNSNHVFHNSLQSCPWCAIEGNTGILLFHFAGSISFNQEGDFNINLVWTQINQIPSPGPAPSLPARNTYNAKPTEEIAELSKKKILRRILSTIFVIASTCILGATMGSTAGIIAFIVSLVIAGSVPKTNIEEKKREITNIFNSTQSKLIQIEQKWNQEAGETVFKNKLVELEKARHELLDLPSLRERKIRQLNQDRHKYQLEAFLDKFDIHKAKIDGIGPGRKATLQSYGIQTAADVNKHSIMKISGFGPVYTSKLIDWRQSLEKKFVFKPNEPIDHTKISAIDNEIKSLRNKLEKALLSGVNELKQISYKTINCRQVILNEYEVCLKEYAQAEANYKAL